MSYQRIIGLFKDFNIMNPDAQVPQVPPSEGNIDPVTGAIIGTALTVGGGALGSFIGNRGRMRLAEHNWAEQLKQWQRENAYNHPVMQRARMEEAGFNPAMAYAKGTLNNVAARSPQRQMAQYQNPNIRIDPFGELIKYQQAKNIAQDTKVKERNTWLMEEQHTKLQMDNWLQAVMQNWETGSTWVNKGGKQVQVSNSELLQGVMDGSIINPAVKDKLAQIATREATKNSAISQADINKVQAQMAKLGINFNDPMWARLGSAYARSKGYDLNTQRGALIAAEAGISLLKMFKGGIMNPQKGRSTTINRYDQRVYPNKIQDRSNYQHFRSDGLDNSDYMRNFMNNKGKG